MIVFIGGPEGAGKTALMTRFCRLHHLLGGEVWAFPGYELKNNRGRVVSQLVNPSEIMGQIENMRYVLLAIDEIQNFMNHHAWQNPVIDVLVYGALSQRRKREFVLIATGPFFKELPPNLQAMFHVVIECWDMHFRNHSIPRGNKIQFSLTDMRGVLGGYPGRRTKPKIFRPQKYFPLYDTFSLVDPKYQHLRVQIKKDIVKVDSSGNIIEYTPPRVIGGIIDEFLKANDKPETIVKFDLNNYISFRLGKEYLDHADITSVGRLMAGRGYQNKMKKALWQLPDLEAAYRL